MQTRREHDRLPHLLAHLRRGNLPDSAAEFLEGVGAAELLAHLRDDHPVVFLDRTTARKHELGVAEDVVYRCGGKRSDGQQPVVWLATTFRECVVVDSYAGSITGITSSSSIGVRPVPDDASSLELTMRRSFKLDKMPDGWRVKPLRQRPIRLAKKVLGERGWRFEVAYPGGREP